MGRCRRLDSHRESCGGSERHVREPAPPEFRNCERGGFKQRCRLDFDGVRDPGRVGEGDRAAVVRHAFIIGEDKANTSGLCNQIRKYTHANAGTGLDHVFGRRARTAVPGGAPNQQRKAAPVVDVMDALRKSLDATRKPVKREASERPGRKKDKYRTK